MSVITNKWNDGSEDSINIESPSFQGNQTVKISSPVQKGTSKRSMKFIGKCKKDSSKQVILTVEQEASTYTYDLTLNSDNTEIVAKGGTANITAVLKTYRNGNLVSTDNVTPVLSGSATGFSISGTKVTASNRTTTIGSRRSIVVTGKYSKTFDDQEVSATINIKQEANSVQSIKFTGFSTFPRVPASGGTVRTQVIGDVTYFSESIEKGVTFTEYLSATFEGGIVDDGVLSLDIDGDELLLSADSLKTVIKEQYRTNGFIKVRYKGFERLEAVYLYQAANSIDSYNYSSWDINISAKPTTIAASGGTSTITSSCTRTKTPVYTSGSTGTATTESATPTLSISGTGFILSGTTVTASKNNIAARTATVTASYSGATSKFVTITQSAGPDGIGYMQIEGDGVDHYIFQVGRTPNTRSNDVQTLSEEPVEVATETKSESLFAKIKRIVTNLN